MNKLSEALIEALYKKEKLPDEVKDGAALLEVVEAGGGVEGMTCSVKGPSTSPLKSMRIHSTEAPVVFADVEVPPGVVEVEEVEPESWVLVWPNV